MEKSNVLMPETNTGVEIEMSTHGKGFVKINGEVINAMGFRFEGGVNRPNVLTLVMRVDDKVKIVSKDNIIKNDTVAKKSGPVAKKEVK